MRGYLGESQNKGGVVVGGWWLVGRFACLLLGETELEQEERDKEER